MRHRRKKVSHRTSIFECQMQAAFQPPERDAAVQAIKQLLDLDGLVDADVLIGQKLDEMMASPEYEEVDPKEAVEELKKAVKEAVLKSNWMDDKWVEAKYERQLGREPHKTCHRKIGRA